MDKKAFQNVWRPVVTAVVAVILVRALLVTSCFIPFSGMENSLYQGEGVLVNKWSYGLRLPFSSLWGYHRLFPDSVKRGDIFLFNDPRPSAGILFPEFGHLFISRCIGLPGDTLMLDHEMMDISHPVLSPARKSLYRYPGCMEDRVKVLMDSLGIKGSALVGCTEQGDYIRSFSGTEWRMLSRAGEKNLAFIPLSEGSDSLNRHPYVVPSKGKAVNVQPWNMVLLCNTIVHHEGKQACIQGDSLIVEGKRMHEYVFSQNYYWVSANDPVNLCDSRLFGFVPESHLIGKAWRIWFPACKERFLKCIQ